jgi:hypothetical protein
MGTDLREAEKRAQHRQRWCGRALRASPLTIESDDQTVTIAS